MPARSESRSSGSGRRPLRGLGVSRHVLLLMASMALCALGAARPALAARTISGELAPRDSSSRSIYGFEIGPTFSVPLMTSSMNRLEPGAEAGLSATLLVAPRVGVGVDVAYHYWPVSRAFKKRFNDYLRMGTWNTLELGGETWGLQVLEYGGHIRLQASEMHGVRSWAAVGLHSFHVDPNMSGYTGDAGFFWVSVPAPRPTDHLGYSVSAGADLFGGRHARMGLHTTYYFVNCSDKYVSDLKVFTAGAHLSFGW